MMEISKEMDIFEENERHELKITQSPVEFENSEIDARKINFSDPEILEFASASLKEMGFV